MPNVTLRILEPHFAIHEKGGERIADRDGDPIFQSLTALGLELLRPNGRIKYKVHSIATASVHGTMER